MINPSVIKLTAGSEDNPEGKPVYVIDTHISGFYRFGVSTKIMLQGGQSVNVRETPEEIIRIIGKTSGLYVAEYI